MMFGAQSQKNRCTKVNISFQSLSVISIKKRGCALWCIHPRVRSFSCEGLLLNHLLAISDVDASR